MLLWKLETLDLGQGIYRVLEARYMCSAVHCDETRWMFDDVAGFVPFRSDQITSIQVVPGQIRADTTLEMGFVYRQCWDRGKCALNEIYRLCEYGSRLVTSCSCSSSHD